jgi:hypothetical protein
MMRCVLDMKLEAMKAVGITICILLSESFQIQGFTPLFKVGVKKVYINLRLVTGQMKEQPPSMWDQLVRNCAWPTCK